MVRATKQVLVCKSYYIWVVWLRTCSNVIFRFCAELESQFLQKLRKFKKENKISLFFQQGNWHWAEDFAVNLKNASAGLDIRSCFGGKPGNGRVISTIPAPDLCFPDQVRHEAISHAQKRIALGLRIPFPIPGLKTLSNGTLPYTRITPISSHFVYWFWTQMVSAQDL